MSTREVSDQPLLSFDSRALLPAEPQSQEKTPDAVARDFVRWCCHFGTEFRNSPDITNLRYWAKKNKVKIKPSDENKVVDIARPLFLKHLERMFRKTESAN